MPQTIRLTNDDLYATLYYDSGCLRLRASGAFIDLYGPVIEVNYHQRKAGGYSFWFETQHLPKGEA